jgi:hypothetical protein
VRCPDGAALAAWVDGEVVGAPAADLDAHIANCPRCERAEKAQRQVKRRTSLLRAAGGAARPNPDLLAMLMTLPQVEHDRALRRAHLANCGDGRRAGTDGTFGTRLRIAVVGAGAAVWLVAAVWSAPPGTTPGSTQPTPAGTTTPTSATPVGVPPTAPVARWTGFDRASAGAVAGH